MKIVTLDRTTPSLSFVKKPVKLKAARFTLSLTVPCQKTFSDQATCPMPPSGKFEVCKGGREDLDCDENGNLKGRNREAVWISTT